MTQYNKEYNCIFVNVPRTASGAMSKHIATGGHRPLSERRNIMFRRGFQDKYLNAYKFGFVRNPYTRFVSAWCHLGLHKKFNVNKFLKPDPVILMTIKGIFDRPSGMEYLIKYQPNLFRPQHEFLDTTDEDFIGRYENLDKDWKKVCRKLGIKDAKLELKNRSVCDVELTDESKQIIYEFYKTDFKEYGYKK